MSNSGSGKSSFSLERASLYSSVISSSALKPVSSSSCETSSDVPSSSSRVITGGTSPVSNKYSARAKSFLVAISRAVSSRAPLASLSAPLSSMNLIMLRLPDRAASWRGVSNRASRAFTSFLSAPMSVLATSMLPPAAAMCSAVDQPLAKVPLLASGLTLPFLRIRSMISEVPFGPAAEWMMPLPALSLWLVLAPASIRALTHAVRPSSTAPCSGVFPNLSTESRSPPLPTIILVSEGLPLLAAACSTVSPFSFLIFKATSAPGALSNRLTVSSRPSAHAKCSGVLEPASLKDRAATPTP
mmetsp:Transcript_9207/g.22564  ORF Transcript_9207/g.22564 Transcript_9207/m.22564 type:complete len:300 (-) Transcript_9207:820-1719(-)